MKKLIIIFTLLVFLSVESNAQIPNNGFENWENYADPANPSNIYQKPDQWIGLLPKSPSTFSFSIVQNSDNYPPGTGQYSMIVKTDSVNGVDGLAASYDLFPSDLTPQYFPPAFPINYRPTSLFLYYKYFPVKGDSMRVAGYFYKNRVVIGGFEYISSQIVSEWTQLEIPINYNAPDIPDSATIILTTFNKIQHDSSMLYVDNLSFDNPVTSIDENLQVYLPENFILFQNYPNPFNARTIIKYSVYKTSPVTIKLYDIIGKEVATLLNEEKTPGDYTIEFDAEGLSSGIYYYQMHSKSFVDTKRLILMK